MASKIRTPIAEMTNLGGIGAAIKAREATIGEARDILASGTLPSGHPVTPRRAIRLRQKIRDAQAELDALYARRATIRSTPTPKPTAQGAPFSSVEDWL